MGSLLQATNAAEGKNSTVPSSPVNVSNTLQVEEITRDLHAPTHSQRNEGKQFEISRILNALKAFKDVVYKDTRKYRMEARDRFTRIHHQFEKSHETVSGVQHELFVLHDRLDTLCADIRSIKNILPAWVAKREQLRQEKLEMQNRMSGLEERVTIMESMLNIKASSREEV
ncbi:hypothetical protein DM02DRAFT_657133 [Periconia macrospinosa]|uniref:Uncharacterized protein n=1 Tax=Periconia macrospinosa TaxID=97972 RepID=A0A2V1DMX7_9PLEO|nr:hypothetical protein DM02DRAFT_657133 [Periconia macrospinosa]